MRDTLLFSLGFAALIILPYYIGKFVFDFIINKYTIIYYNFDNPLDIWIAGLLSVIVLSVFYTNILKLIELWRK